MRAVSIQRSAGVSEILGSGLQAADSEIDLTTEHNEVSRKVYAIGKR